MQARVVDNGKTLAAETPCLCDRSAPVIAFWCFISFLLRNKCEQLGLPDAGYLVAQ